MSDDINQGRIALVTGANRGLGFETCRQLRDRGFTVVLSAKEREVAQAAADSLGVDHLCLDVSRGDSIARAASRIRDQYGRLDVLVNNAGISMTGFDGEVAQQTLAINVFAPMAMVDACQSVMARQSSIVMVSSGMGALSNLPDAVRDELADPKLTRLRLAEILREFVRAVEEGTSEQQGWPRSAYRVSKAGLNAATRVLARELADTGIKINAVCPGWVRTDMGGSEAPVSVEDGARGITWAATIPAGGPSGGFFRNGEPVEW